MPYVTKFPWKQTVPLEVKDLAGISQPLTKLIEVVSSAIGTLYKPKNIRAIADARGYEVKVLARAESEAGIETRRLYADALEDRISVLARQNPMLAERARHRLLMREIEGQLNVEEVVEHAALALPAAVSSEPIAIAWRRKFFQEAENVCEADMQALWGKVLAGEIAQPGAFGLRTLETLKQVSRSEAELYRQACGVAMESGWIAMLGDDINTTLKPFGISFDNILALRDAGLLLHGNGIHQGFPMPEGVDRPELHREVLTNNGVFIELSGAHLSQSQFPCLLFTKAGRELQRLISVEPNEEYLSAFGTAVRQRGLVAKRGQFIPQSEFSSVLVFETDL